jgi:hypothetical protein
MHPSIRNVGSYALGGTIVLASLCLLAAFILGTAWIGNKALPALFVACWIAVGIDVIALLLSVVRRLRPVTGWVIVMSSLVLGLTSWLLSFMLTYDLWGTTAVVIGLLLFGGAVVPFALLATLFHGMWAMAAAVTILLVLTFATRWGGAVLSESAQATTNDY